MELRCVMSNREMNKPVHTQYFAEDSGYNGMQDEGCRDMIPLSPFVVSGGRNTERYYFMHVNALSTHYKFNIRPEYFGDESSYAEVFPQRIQRILHGNADAIIFCVFDMDTVVANSSCQANHEEFKCAVETYIQQGQVVLCESMPSFEYWLLLHFVDFEGKLRNYSEVCGYLASYLKPYFNDSTKRFSKLIKGEKYLQDSVWVERLIREGRIEEAVERAKMGLERNELADCENAYTKVFKAFSKHSIA